MDEHKTNRRRPHRAGSRPTTILAPVPIWVDQAIGRLREEALGWGDDDEMRQGCESAAEALKKMKSDDGCLIVWRQLGRLALDVPSSAEVERTEGMKLAKTLPDQRTPQVLSEFIAELAISASRTDSHYAWSKNAVDLAYLTGTAVAEALAAQPDRSDTRKNRRAKARKVRKLFTSLDNELFKTPRLWPQGYNRFDAAHDVSERIMDDEIHRFCSAFGGYSAVVPDIPGVAAIQRGGFWASMRVQEVLEAHVSALEKWAEQPLDLPHPGDERAARLIFLRSLSSQFREIFGEPLHGSVLAIACLYFDCAGLDEASIARLTLSKSS